MNRCLSPAQQQIRRRLSHARGLPAWTYTSEAMAELERECVFATHWVCVGLECDVANPGDVTPVECAGRRLLMVRALDGSLGVFHNWCRHRGITLLRESRTQCRRIVCPYHSWVYNLDGSLAHAPHYHGPNAPSDCAVNGLLAVRFATWAGLVFVNLSGDAKEFETFIAPLASRWRHYRLDALRRGASKTLRVACNWKLAVENFIDFYHLPSVHQGLNRYSAMSDHYFVQCGDDVVGQGNSHYAPSDEASGVVASLPALRESAQSITEAVSLFPNLLLTIFHNNLRVIRVEPCATTQCCEQITVFVDADAACDPSLAQAPDALLARFEAFNNEDVQLLGTLQQSMQHSEFDGGCFSPYFDRSVEHFQKQIRNAIDTGCDTD